MIMKTRYSPSTGNFYPFAVAYRNLPKDLIEVDQVDYDKAMSRLLGASFSFNKDKLVIIESPINSE